ncbi:MAG TPA: hypothetical protein DD381_12120 [Lentisphaeria bacterium]|nr:MAG: hypothetical protein A2X47_09610 [Lentisphaerae bacterium GWF2_38_69]HBM17072.1 hypothetical protein [Lentisphaeria bacterium]
MFILNPLKYFFKFFIVILLMLGLIWGLISIYRIITYTSITKESVLTILKSENIVFLVTDRIVSQIYVEISENSPLLGKREGILIGTVTMYYGIDLAKLDSSSIQKTDNAIIVSLPEPGELDFSVDPSSLKYITKRSGLNVIADYILNRDIEQELRGQMNKNALIFFKDKNLIPTKSRIIAKLDSFFEPIAKELNTKITFK